MKERLQKILSAHGAVSRRESEKMIAQGRVTVNGVTAILGQSADIGSDIITVDGVKIESNGEKVYIMLNKPRGYITTMRDERNRKTVTQLTKNAKERVYPAGRLDMDSEGLLILTNDGDFANRVMHPSYGKQKTYRVTVKGEISDAVDLLKKPMELDGHIVTAARVELESKTKSGGTLIISISEGRNRQIRRMCAMCGLEVKRLLRVSVGGVELGGLKTGQWRYLTDAEVKTLMGEG